MSQRFFETLRVRAGFELLTLVVPTEKILEIQRIISKLDFTNRSSINMLERFLLKSNGFIRE